MPDPTIKQELRSLQWVCKRIMRLSPASRDWLRSWLADPGAGGGGHPT